MQMRMGLGLSRATAVPLDPAAATLIARMSTPPTAARRTAINSLISGLRGAGIWAKLDSLQVYAAHDAQASLLDWVNASRTATATASFTTDRGYTTGTNAVVDMGFGPSTSGVSMTLNSQTFGFFSDTSETNNTGSVAGCWDGVRGTTMAVRQPINPAMTFRVNTATSTQNNTQYASNGLWGVVRSSSSVQRLLRDGAEVLNGSVASTALASTNFFLGGLNSSGGAVKRFNAAYAGQALSDPEHAQFNTLIRAYMTAVGVI